MMNIFSIFKHRGATASAYGLVVGLIAIVGLGAITTSGQAINTLFTGTAGTLQNVVDETATPAPSSSPYEAPGGLVFSDLTDQSVNALLTSNAVTVTGQFDPVTVSITGDGNPEFSIAGDGFSNTPRNLSPGDSLQLRLTSSSSFSTSNSATVTVGTESAIWSVTTEAQGGVLVPGNTTLVVERDGFQVTCEVWDGDICQAPRVNPSNATAWINASTYYGSPNLNEFMSLWHGDAPAVASVFCHMATGNGNVVQHSNYAGTGSNSTSSMLANYTSCTSGSYYPCIIGTYDTGITTHDLTFMNDSGSNTSRGMECQGW